MALFMMNELHVGFGRNVEPYRSGCLFMTDEVMDVPRSRVFDPLIHHFNPLRGVNYKRARELSEVIYTAFPQGENTLTVRNGKRALLRALMSFNRLDRIKGDEEVMGLVGDILASPVLSKVFCGGKQFSFNPDAVVIARIDRRELGDFDALMLGLFLLATYQGQVVVPELGFYGRDAHAALIREGRLIAGVDSLGDLPPRLSRAALSIKDKIARAALFEDAKTLALYAGKMPGTDGFDTFVKDAMGLL